MKKTRIMFLTVVVISQVFYVRFLISSHKRQGHMEKFNAANEHFNECLASNDFAGCTNYLKIMDAEAMAYKHPH